MNNEARKLPAKTKKDNKEVVKSPKDEDTIN